MHYNVILNPAGASGRTLKLWKELEPLFSKHSYSLHRSTKEHPVGEICRELTSRGEQTAIVVIGGDGTANEALNGIADLENTAFGFIPCGTGNDMVRDMQLPGSKKALAERILKGEVRRCVDIGELQCIIDGKKVSRLFNISSDIGFGAATCAFVEHSKLKKVLNRIGLGKLVYLIEAVKVCFTTPPAEVRVRMDGKTLLCHRCLTAIAMNHMHEGGGFRFCPDADFSDGKLDLCIGCGLSKLGFLMILPQCYLGRHRGKHGILLERTRSVEMTSDRPLWVHTDGEVLGMTQSVKMRIIPEKLNLLF